jgi:hypothetical protein
MKKYFTVHLTPFPTTKLYKYRILKCVIEHPSKLLYSETMIMKKLMVKQMEGLRSVSQISPKIEIPYGTTGPHINVCAKVVTLPHPITE